MTIPNMESIRNEITRNIKNMNQAWRKGDFRSLRKYFHQEMVIVAPNFQRMGVGIDACVKSYEDFAAMAEVINFLDKNMQVDIIGSTAAVTYEYEITWVAEEKRFEEAGKEALVFTKESGSWLLIWRMVLPPAAG